MDETSCRAVSDGIHADDVIVCGADDVFGKYVVRLGIMLAASEVPRIAQQFGLDSSTKFNMMSAVHATTTAINLTRAIARSGK